MNINHSTRIPELLELLRARTTFLERILSHSEQFRLISETGGGMENWLLKREKLFRTYELADSRIDWASRQILESGERLPQTFRKSIENEMTRASILIQRIRQADEGVVLNIQEAQSRILKEISDSRAFADRLGRFKSNRHPITGEEFDGQG